MRSDKEKIDWEIRRALALARDDIVSQKIDREKVKDQIRGQRTVAYHLQKCGLLAREYPYEFTIKEEDAIR